MKQALALVLPALALVVGAACRSEPSRPLRVAAAANVADLVTALGEDFRKVNGQRVEVSAGSSGKLFAQIEHGAPFDAFFSADAERPAALEKSGRGVQGTRFTYALGRLALCGRALRRTDDGAVALDEAVFTHFAIANPDTAPYGAAAIQVLRRLGRWESVEPKTVRGESVIQALQFVESGSAELGLLARASVVGRPGLSCWTVPAALHDPIVQSAILLAPGRDRPIASAFLEFARSDAARRRLVDAGYDLPP